MTDTVTIERREYQALLDAKEELADIQALDHAKARLASDEDELIPAEYANRIIDGESPLRVYRNYRDLTQATLSAMSGVNRVQIAEIEGGSRTGSVATLRSLADALGVSIDDIAP